MSRIIVQAFVWNSAQFIAAPILAVHEYVDEIQVFDGAYEWMGKAGYAKVPWSTDGTEQVVKSLKLACPLKWIPCEQFYTQKTKRDLMVEEYWRKENGDAWRYLMADDEMPAGNIAKAFRRIRQEKQASKGFVRAIEIRGRKMYQPPAPDRKRFQRLCEGGNIKLDEMFIIHLKWLRTRGRLKAQLDYEVHREKQYKNRLYQKYIRAMLEQMEMENCD